MGDQFEVTRPTNALRSFNQYWTRRGLGVMLVFRVWVVKSGMAESDSDCFSLWNRLRILDVHCLIVHPTCSLKTRPHFASLQRVACLIVDWGGYGRECVLMYCGFYRCPHDGRITLSATERIVWFPALDIIHQNGSYWYPRGEEILAFSHPKKF